MGIEASKDHVDRVRQMAGEYGIAGGACCGARLAPQEGQNLESSGTGVPQLLQYFISLSVC